MAKELSVRLHGLQVGVKILDYIKNFGTKSNRG